MKKTRILSQMRKAKRWEETRERATLKGLERVFPGIKALWHPARLTVKILTKIVMKKKR